MEKCVASCVPLLVCEYDTQKCFVCPNCHSVIDREYTTFCNCCGQKLSWYGTFSHAQLLGEEPSAKQRKKTGKALSGISPLEDQSRAIQAEINLLREQISEKRSELKKLNEAQEEKKRNQLMKAISQSGRALDDLILLVEKLEA